jgi:hypothetical protein
MPTAAVVGVVAIVAIYLSPVGVGALLTLAGGGYGTTRYLTRGQRQKAKPQNVGQAKETQPTDDSPDEPPPV